MYTKTLTLSALIAELQKFEVAGHGEMEVTTEGCDCTGDAGSVVNESPNLCILRTQEIKTLPTDEEIAESELRKILSAELHAKKLAILKVRPLTDAELCGDFSKTP